MLQTIKNVSLSHYATVSSKMRTNESRALPYHIGDHYRDPLFATE